MTDKTYMELGSKRDKNELVRDLIGLKPFAIVNRNHETFSVLSCKMKKETFNVFYNQQFLTDFVTVDDAYVEDDDFWVEIFGKGDDTELVYHQ